MHCHVEILVGELNDGVCIAQNREAILRAVLQKYVAAFTSPEEALVIIIAAECIDNARLVAPLQANQVLLRAKDGPTILVKCVDIPTALADHVLVLAKHACRLHEVEKGPGLVKHQLAHWGHLTVLIVRVLLVCLVVN